MQKRFASLIVRQFAIGLVLAYLCVILMPALISGRSQWGFWQVMLMIALAASSAASLAGHLRAAEKRDAAESDRLATREWERNSGPGWFARYVGYGVLMGLGIGVPVGALVGFGSTSDALLNGSSVQTMLVFVAFTMAWTVPMAFAIRWGAMRRAMHTRRPEGR